MTDLEHLSRADLAALGREYMIFAHLLNRAALPHVHMKVGPEAREAVAIEEWMGASPIYTQRLQRCFGFEGNGVETIFKGFQLDVGFPHQYMDVRYQLEGPERGLFWLQSCGALLEVEQYGEGAVISMCHHIEDPTFDASAVATNPLARCRPVHRPPRVPAARVPHCQWEVFIDHTAEPLTEIAITKRVRTSKLAAVELAPVVGDGRGGWDDYRRPFDPDFRLEHLSRGALVRACCEFLVQDHLLVRALMIAVAERAGDDMAQRIASAQWVGAGTIASARVRRALRIAGDGIDAIAAVLRLHPAFLPTYARTGISSNGERGRLWIEDCDALREGDAYSWYALLGDAAHPALDAMVQAVNPRARCVPATPHGDERFAWDMIIDAAAEPAEVPVEASMVASSNTARFAFRGV